MSESLRYGELPSPSSTIAPWRRARQHRLRHDSFLSSPWLRIDVSKSERQCSQAHEGISSVCITCDHPCWAFETFGGFRGLAHISAVISDLDTWATDVKKSLGWDRLISDKLSPDASATFEQRSRDLDQILDSAVPRSLYLYARRTELLLALGKMLRRDWTISRHVKSVIHSVYQDLDDLRNLRWTLLVEALSFIRAEEESRKSAVRRQCAANSRATYHEILKLSVFEKFGVEWTPAIRRSLCEAVGLATGILAKTEKNRFHFRDGEWLRGLQARDEG